jgi:hypothetical protein
MGAVGDRAEGVQLVDCRVHYLAAGAGESLRNFNQMWSGSIDDGARDDGAGTGAAVPSVAGNRPLKDYRIRSHTLIDVDGKSGHDGRSFNSLRGRRASGKYGR